MSAAEAIQAAQDDGVVIVDIRDPREIEREGRIPGAFSCTRGMLEFWIDPDSPYAKPLFQEDKKFIFHCAGGLRSALAAKTAQDMGLKPVAHVAGGFRRLARRRRSGGEIRAEEEGLMLPSSFRGARQRELAVQLHIEESRADDFWIPGSRLGARRNDNEDFAR